VYSGLAKAARVQGDVLVETTVSETGDVINARVISGHALLQQTALTAARQWKFEPAVYNGNPVKSTGILTFRFTLPAKEDDQDVVSRSEGVIRGNAIKRIVPEYPEQARSEHIEGDVVLEIKINEEGQVYSVEVQSGPKALWDACLKAASQWKFNPTVIEGKPVKVMGQITFRFTM
jgi:TonB family protein